MKANLVIRLVLAGAFFWAGAVKLSNPEVFAVTVRAFGLLPDGLVNVMAVVLPALEVVAAVLLALGRREGLALTAGLLAVFVAVLVYALRMGLDIDCGCYGPSDVRSEAFGSIRQALWRDAAMLAAVAWLAWGGRTKHREEAPLAAKRQPTEEA